MGNRYNIATVRNLLRAAFTPQDLYRFCYDEPDFRPVIDEFGLGLSFNDMVDQVVVYCDKRNLLGILLERIQVQNPGQYDRFALGLLLPASEQKESQQEDKKDRPAKRGSLSPLPEPGSPQLVDSYAALVDHARSLAFPSYRKGVAAPPEGLVQRADADKLSTGVKRWSAVRRGLFRLSSPLPTVFLLDATSSFSRNLLAFFLILGLWIVALSIWGTAADTLLEFIFVPSARTYESQAGASFNIAAVLFLFGMLASGLLAYWRWLEFMRDTRYPRWARLSFALVFLGIIASSPYLVLEPQYRALFPGLLLQERTFLTLFIITYVLFIIPFFTFYYSLLMDLLVVVGWILVSVSSYLVALFNPLPKMQIVQVAFEPICEVGAEKGEWRLADLPASTLRVLHDWAEANREGTQKRLLAAVLLLGGSLVLANTNLFSVALDSVLAGMGQFLTNLPQASASSLSLEYIGTWTAFSLVAIILMIPIIVILILLANLTVQNLIVEACIVAGHSSEQPGGS